MKLEITFEELNAIATRKTRGIVSLKPLAERDSFQISTGIGIISAPLKLYFDKIVDGNQLVFNYKMPFGMNIIIEKMKEKINELIPRRIVEFDSDRRQITVNLMRIEEMKHYFEHFDISSLQIANSAFLLSGKLKPIPS